MESGEPARQHEAQARGVCGIGYKKTRLRARAIISYGAARLCLYAKDTMAHDTSSSKARKR